MLYEYLLENYKINEPIFLADINLPVTDNNLRQMFKVLCDKGNIVRYDTGIYYIKGTSRLKGSSTLSASEVARYKYIERNERVNGYYSGYTFANQLGLITQVPYTIEIVSNFASAKCREIKMHNQKVMLRKPRTRITKDNSSILQLLDLLKDLEIYVDDNKELAVERLAMYIKELGFKRLDIDKYISLYPERIYKIIYETRLYNVFA